MTPDLELVCSGLQVVQHLYLSCDLMTIWCVHCRYASSELVQLSLVSLCLCSAWLCGQLGLSEELGAFMAGKATSWPWCWPWCLPSWALCVSRQLPELPLIDCSAGAGTAQLAQACQNNSPVQQLRTAGVVPTGQLSHDFCATEATTSR